MSGTKVGQQIITDVSGLNVTPTGGSTARVRDWEAAQGGRLDSLEKTTQGWVNVANYGAVGDGSHPTQDTDALVDAIAAAPTGGTVKIPAGTFDLADVIPVTGTGINIEGCGFRSILRISHPGDAFLITGSLFRLRNVEVVIGSTADRTGAAVLHIQGGQGLVDDIRVTSNAGSPNNGMIYLLDHDAADMWTFSNVRIPGGTAPWQSALKMTLVSGTIASTKAYGWLVPNARFTEAAINVDGAIDTLQVVESDINTYAGSAIRIANTVGAGSGFPRYLKFTNVSIEGGRGGGNPTTALDMQAGLDLRYVGGYIASARVGAALGSGVKGAQFLGTEFRSIDREGITVDAAAEGVDISHNTFRDMGQETHNTYDTISVAGGATRLKIIGNYFDTPGATKPRYHIALLNGTTTRYQIIGNTNANGSAGTGILSNAATGSQRNIWANDGVPNVIAGDSTSFNQSVAFNTTSDLIARKNVQNDAGDLVLTSSTGKVTVPALVPTRSVPSYGASIAINAALGNEFAVTATNGSAFAFAAPTNPSTGQRITIRLRNTSGGALGAATWDAIYKMAAWTNPANGQSRSIDFQYDGTNWVEVSRTPADVPN